MNISQEVLAALIGVLALALGWMFTWVKSISDNVIRIQTTIDIMGINAARTLHSPHTPKLDVLLDKYIDRNYELTAQEWNELLEDCNAIVENKQESHGYRLSAAWLAAICHP